jgi:serine/threonine protein kinase
MDLAQGDRLGPYEVLSPLGAGGMGEVYKARDTRLNRTLALKVLPSTASNEERRRRFIREAKAASSLNHPNIVHIYDIGEDAGRRFIAMEYVAGVTLQKKIGASGLAMSELLTYAVGIADALATAHSAGIVHCDLKPANVMVTTDGVAKVLDFGVAKLVEPVDVDAVTRTEAGGLTGDQALGGTLAYMSPEQALGKPIDRRSDIFSFGTVLYEMATGRRAFQRESSVATLTAIIQEEPRRMTSVMRECPAELDDVVSRCLRKDPSRRFQHMDDVKVALLELKERNGATRTTRDTGGARHRRSLRAQIAWVIVPARRSTSPPFGRSHSMSASRPIPRCLRTASSWRLPPIGREPACSISGFSSFQGASRFG